MWGSEIILGTNENLNFKGVLDWKHDWVTSRVYPCLMVADDVIEITIRCENISAVGYLSVSLLRLQGPKYARMTDYFALYVHRPA